ncbi:MAG TPA: glycoside hydrolase family 3 C-terminal domain-containing protein [Terriglobia bacterium]|nr:glycoside hydrolase family 3 C-terminal domain-containing protein [Terriglobia bacterium]
MTRKSPCLLAAVTTLAAGFAANALQAQSASAPGAAPEKPPYFNPSLPIARRVNDLVARMTLEEKVRQMQHTAPAIPRLGVPAYDWWNEALHGVARSGFATVFPQAIGMAATWDAPLVHREGETIATEARAKFNQAQRDDNHSIYFGLTFWSPNINIFRDPRWGRGQETYGEDPFLTARLGVAFVTGLQGDDPKYFKVISTPKHYAVHSGPEPLRHGFNVNPSPRDLEDTYLPAFRATVVEGHADSVMCAYNAIDGQPACANPYLLQKTLRDAWKFPGYVTSDCGAVDDIMRGHHFAPDLEHASALAVEAGTDTTCGNEYVALVKAVHDGVIKESELDTALQRLFTARFRLGMFDPPDAVAFNQIPMSEDDSPAHQALALQAARESMVLLKNRDGFLPLKPELKNIAVIGPNAEALPALEGNYNGTPSHPVLPIDGLEKEFAGKAEVLYAQGSPYVSELPVPVPRTVFHPASGDAAPGLKAEYFANTDFSGSPVLTRIDPQIQFDWDAASPAPGVPMKAFAVRWTGTLTPPGPGDYTFGIDAAHCYPCGDKETFRVFLDGKPVSESSHTNFSWSPKVPVIPVHFDDTAPHDFRLEYTHTAPLFAAGVTLTWKPPVDVLRAEAVKVAGQSDVIVAFVGLSPNLEGEEMPIHVEGFNGGDRTDIGLPRAQQDLLEALEATGKPLVVVLMNGSALAVNWAQQHAAAILEAWYSGEAGGAAIAETLSGANNPGGRLPVTFYAALDQLPPFQEYSMANRTYRYFTGQPLYRFGDGLSYSTFSYSRLKLSTTNVRGGASLRVEADLRNTSKIAGDEVAEVYLAPAPGSSFYRPPSAPASQPFPVLLRELKGFERVHLAAGETRHVAFTLSPRDLSQVTEAGLHKVLPGRYAVSVGGGQPGTGAPGVSAEFQITGETTLPR